MIKTRKINDFKISKIKLPTLSEKKIRGGDLLPIYSNTFICAKKNSGKTTVIFNILKKCVDKDTIVDLFVSTIEKDRSWLQIVDYLKNKGVTVNQSMSTVGPNGDDLIRKIIDQPVVFSDEEDSDSEEETTTSYISLHNTTAPDEPRKRRKTKMAQKRIIILDDIGNELKKPTIDQLLKVNRHLHSKVILSSQYLNDLSPQARRQIDVWLLFTGCKKEKLSTVMRDCDTHLDYDVFEQVYKYATAKKYNFLYIDCHNSKFRKNFNEQLEVDVD
jgi:hypothetical protein